MKTLLLAAIRCSLLFLVTASLFSVRPARAYTVTLEEVGADVVATGSGAINLTGLTFFASGVNLTPGILPDFGLVSMGPGGAVHVDVYYGFTGPRRFGRGKSYSTATLAAETLSHLRPLHLFSTGKL
jgi:hypothetical protein